MEQFQKLSGIYQIRNKQNNKKYIGKSINITNRWLLHLINLMSNKHTNNNLQEEFNKYGIENFEFSILALTSNNNLTKLEQQYINTLDSDYDYNKHNSFQFGNYNPDIDKFIDYINSKWLIPKIHNIDLKPFKIYKPEDKQEIIKQFIDCDLCSLVKLYPYQITFNRVIRFMTDTLGYTIENGRIQVKRKTYTYKLIVDFDEGEGYGTEENIKL